MPCRGLGHRDAHAWSSTAYRWLSSKATKTPRAKSLDADSSSSSLALRVIKPPKATSSIYQTLSSQDPEGRIRFLPQRVDYEHVLHRFGSDVDLATARESVHLLPFWTVVFLCDVRRGMRHRETGWVQNGLPRQSYMDIGCSIAAVPTDHWASGLVLIDDLRMLVEGQAGIPDLKVSPRLKVYDHDEIGWDGMAAKKWDTSRAPKFAFSYPHIVREDAVKLSTLPQITYGDYTETWKINNAPTTFAVPSYRVGYKVDLTGGRVAYVDGHYGHSSHSFILSHRDGALASNFSWTPTHSVRYNARKLFEGFHTTQVAREPLLPAVRSAEFAEMMMRAMTRSPIDWTDEAILPLRGSDRGAVLLGQRLDDRIFGRVEAVDQAALPTPAGPAPTLKPSKVSSAAAVPPRPDPRVTNLGDVAIPMPAPQQDRAPPRSSRRAINAPTMRATVLSRVIASQSKLRPTAPRPARPVLPATQPITPARIADAEGFYALLGITPTASFLDLDQASAVEKHLSERRRILALKFHEDRGGAWEGEMSRINAAFDHVSTYAKRKQYEAGIVGATRYT